jgi:hypothetical protein
MPDPMQQPTPGQVLAGPQQAPPSAPNAANLQAPSAPAQPPAQPQTPPVNPQQVAATARHAAIGRVADFLFNNQRDPETGQRIKQAPGAVFRSLLAGALLGGAMGSEGQATGGSVGGFLGGLGRGGTAVEQQTYQRQQQAQAQAQRQQAASLEERKFDQQQMMDSATLEHWNSQNLANAREADYRERDQLLKENDQDANIQKWAVENGAYLAPTIPNNGVPGNGPDLMKRMVQNPALFNPPAGTSRLLVKHYDFDGLDHDAKNGWTENGKPVDWSKHLQWDVYYVPQNSADKNEISMSGADWHRLYGVNFPPGSDPSKMYNIKAVAPLVAVATSNRKQEREDANQTFKEKHDVLNATVNSARTNLIELNAEKRELIRNGEDEDSESVRDIQQKIDAETKREQDAIGEMHPRIRERVAQPSPAQPRASQAPRTAPSTAPKKGDVQTYSGFTYTFNGSQWVKGKPAPAQ